MLENHHDDRKTKKKERSVKINTESAVTRQWVISQNTLREIISSPVLPRAYFLFDLRVFFALPVAVCIWNVLNQDKGTVLLDSFIKDSINHDGGRSVESQIRW